MNRMTQNMKKVMSVMLAVAMMLTLNLANLTVHAAAETVDKPETQTEIETPMGIESVTVGSNEMLFYEDNNDPDHKYIRYMYPATTRPGDLSSLSVAIVSDDAVTSADVTITKDNGTYTFTADLLNKAIHLTIGDEDYILAVGIIGGTRDLTTDTVSGYVSSAKLAGKNASVTSVITSGTCPGNVYYAQQGIGWTTETCYISANGIKASNPGEVSLVYSISGGASSQSKTVDLSTGSCEVTLGTAPDAHKYTVTASFVKGFTATAKNFRIDFTEMRNSTAAGRIPDAQALQQAKEIEAGVKAYYAAFPAETYPEGTTNMQVLQTMLQWCADNGYIDGSKTTLGSGVTYVAEINGLGEFSVGSMSGWMYTDDPSNSDVTKWPTPAVGGADYVLSSGSDIVWFFTVNYGTHPW